jgi:sugar phosphate isomerase/epimerase
LGARIRHVHIKDHVGTRSVALGAGETPNRAVLDRLRDRGFDGYASIEVECEDKRAQDDAVAAAFRYAVEELGCKA